MNDSPSRLSRRLDTKDAVVLGLGSMIGAGVFAATGPAAAAAGSGLLIGLVIAGVIAYLNATTMARLAAVYPESGGAYVYGRKRLGNFWGFLAGWGFVIGKLASCTAMALTFAHYVAPDHARPLAIAAVLLLTFVNYLGVKKTAFVTKVLVGLVLATLALVVLAALAGGSADPVRLSGWTTHGGVSGILQSAGIMFFAFAGYARIATLGEEVRSPQTTIPRAILIALGITVGVYFVVATVTVLCVDAITLAESATPLALAVASGTFAELAPIVRVGAGIASLGVLLSLMAGISRTTFAMAANADLPRWLSAVHSKHRVPHRAEITVGVIVALIVSVADLRSAIGFSSFAILTYYAIANIAALTLDPQQRRWPRAQSAIGALACLVIAVSLPTSSIVGGLALFGVGALVFFSRITKPIDGGPH